MHTGYHTRKVLREFLKFYKIIAIRTRYMDPNVQLQRKKKWEEWRPSQDTE